MTLNSPAEVYCIVTAAASSSRRLAGASTALPAGVVDARRELANDFGGAGCYNYSYRLWDVAGNGWTGSSLIVMNETKVPWYVTLDDGSSGRGQICLGDGIYHVYCDGAGSNPGQNGWSFDDLFTGECPSSPAYFEADGGVATFISTPTTAPTNVPTPVPTSVTDFDPSVDTVADLMSSELRDLQHGLSHQRELANDRRAHHVSAQHHRVHLERPWQTDQSRFQGVQWYE
jgi:hypothetical protein